MENGKRESESVAGSVYVIRFQGKKREEEGESMRERERERDVCAAKEGAAASAKKR